MEINEEKAENTPAGGVLMGKKDGQTIIHDKGTMSGYLVGKLHRDGGIKAVNKTTGQPLEMQGGEVIITAPAVSDQTKREFEGKMMTNREILSAINEKGGGVSFANGGDIPAKLHTTDCEYKFGGKVVKDTDIAHSLGMNSTLKKGKQQFSSGDTTYDVDAIYNAIKKGKLRLKTKEVETFAMKYPIYDKEYSETVKTDFRKPNGIMVRLENGEEVLIDGNHRMNNAYLKGKKTIKTYYIEDPKQIAKFTKKNKFELGGENKVGGHLSKNKSLKQIAEMHNVSLAHINEQLAKGLEVEKEHFADFKERTRVAKDHLVENPNYYSILEKAGLRNGGHLKSHHKHGENLVKDAEDGNTPARDLNNYNDLLDVQADGAVGGDSGIYAKGGGVDSNNSNYVDPAIVEKLKDIGFDIYREQTSVPILFFGKPTYYPLETPDGKKTKMVILGSQRTLDGFKQEIFIVNWRGSDWYVITFSDLYRKKCFTRVIEGKIINGQSQYFEFKPNTPAITLIEEKVTKQYQRKIVFHQTLEAIRVLKEIILKDLPIPNLEEPQAQGQTITDDKITSKEKKKIEEVDDLSELLEMVKSGNYADGGQVSNFFKKTYGNLVEKQGIITTKTDWLNKDGVKVLEYGFDPYRHEKSNTLFYYSWDYDDSGMDYDDFKNQLVDFFKKTYKKDVSELKALYVGWDRKEKDTYANGGEVANEPKEGDLITNFGKYGVSIFDVDDNYVYWLDQYASKQHCKKSDLFLNNLDDDGDDDGYYEDERNNWVCNKVYANGGVTPIDANLEGDSVDIVEDEFAKGGVVYDTTKPTVDKITIRETKYDGGSNLYSGLRENIVGKEATNISYFINLIKDYVGQNPIEQTDWISFYVNDGKRGNYYIDLNKDKKNTVKNVNPKTGGGNDIKRVIDAKTYLVKNYDWTEFFGGQRTKKDNSVIRISVSYDSKNISNSSNLKLTNNTLELYNFLRGLHIGDYENIKLQPIGNALGVDPIEVNLSTFSWDNLLMMSPQETAVKEINRILYGLFPNLNFDKFVKSEPNSNASKELDLKDTKVWIGDDPKLSEEIQKIAFSLGWGWGYKGADKVVKDIQAQAFYFDEYNVITYSSGISGRSFYEMNKGKELNPQDILLAKKPTITTTQSQYPEYYEFVDDTRNSFTKGKIYKVRNPKDIEAGENFIDDNGITNGFSGNNAKYFKPSTEEAFLAQNSGGSTNSAQILNSSNNQISLEPKIVDAVNVEFVYPNGRIEVSATINVSNLKNALANFWNIVDKKSWEVRITPFENQFTPFEQKKLIIGNDFAEFNPETFSEEQLGNKLKKLYPDLDWSVFLREKTTTAKPFDFTDTKIDVKNNPALSIRVQKQAFENGWEWESGKGKNIDLDPFNYLYFTKKSISEGSGISSFNNSPKREITEEEIFGGQKNAFKITDLEVTSINLSFEVNGNPTYYSGLRTGKDFIEAINNIEQYNKNIDVPVKFDVSYKVVNKFGGSTTENKYQTITFGKGAFVPSNWTVSEIKSILSDDWFLNVLNFDKIFSDIVSVRSSTAQPFDLSKTKIVLDDPEMSEKVQKRAFELGWSWNGSKEVKNTNERYMFFDKEKNISSGSNFSGFQSYQFKEIFEHDLFGSQGSNLEPYEASQVTLNWENELGRNQKATFYNDGIVANGQVFISYLKEIEKNSNGKDVEVSITAYAQDNNGKEIERDAEFTIGENWFQPSTRTNEQIKSIVENEWIDGINFDKFFQEAQTPTSNSVVPKTANDEKFTDFKEVVGKLEGFASKASEKYNTKKYEESLELLNEVKDDYALALSFTPESSFMYERIELMKKIAEVQKEITRITELKSGGAYYILSKVIERLEKGEDWKESGRGEIMTNEVPQQEIDSVIHTEKFKNWFGNWEKALITKEYDYVSKAITEMGKPCVMYHGAKRIKFSYRQVSNGVLYLAENRSYAEWFSANESPYQKQGDYLTQCFVNIKNPIDLTPLGVEELDLRDIIQFIDSSYPLAKIYEVLQPNTAMQIMNNNLIGGQLFRAWNIIRQYPKLNEHIRDNTSYDGFIYYENNPSDKIISEITGELQDNVTKATAVFNSNQVKLVDAMLFDSSLDDWRFETGGKVN